LKNLSIFSVFMVLSLSAGSSIVFANDSQIPRCPLGCYTYNSEGDLQIPSDDVNSFPAAGAGIDEHSSEHSSEHSDEHTNEDAMLATFNVTPVSSTRSF